MIVEDEPDMVELVAMRLRRERYDVDIARDGLEALNRILAAPPDLVLLDLMLPKLSGAEVITELRKDPRTAGVPVIMLTAKSEESDVVLGLHHGADDYVAKPFSLSVLMARISAVLRRTAQPQTEQTTLNVGALTIDKHRYEVRVDGKPIVLTLTEFRILLAIVEARGRVLTRQQLIHRAIGQGVVVTDRAVDVHIAALRRKLEASRDNLVTVRGVGYRWAEPSDETS